MSVPLKSDSDEISYVPDSDEEEEMRCNVGEEKRKKRVEETESTVRCKVEEENSAEEAVKPLTSKQTEIKKENENTREKDNKEPIRQNNYFLVTPSISKQIENEKEKGNTKEKTTAELLRQCKFYKVTPSTSKQIENEKEKGNTKEKTTAEFFRQCKFYKVTPSTSKQIENEKEKENTKEKVNKEPLRQNNFFILTPSISNQIEKIKEKENTKEKTNEGSLRQNDFSTGTPSTNKQIENNKEKENTRETPSTSKQTENQKDKENTREKVNKEPLRQNNVFTVTPSTSKQTENKKEKEKTREKANGRSSRLTTPQFLDKLTFIKQPTDIAVARRLQERDKGKRTSPPKKRSRIITNPSTSSSDEAMDEDQPEERNSSQCDASNSNEKIPSPTFSNQSIEDTMLANLDYAQDLSIASQPANVSSQKKYGEPMNLTHLIGSLVNEHSAVIIEKSYVVGDVVKQFEIHENENELVIKHMNKDKAKKRPNIPISVRDEQTPSTSTGKAGTQSQRLFANLTPEQRKRIALNKAKAQARLRKYCQRMEILMQNRMRGFYKVKTWAKRNKLSKKKRD